MAQPQKEKVRLYLDKVERSWVDFLQENVPELQDLDKQQIAHLYLREILSERVREVKQLQRQTQRLRNHTSGLFYNLVSTGWATEVAKC